MSSNIFKLESAIAFRKGSNAQGVRLDLQPTEIPSEILALLSKDENKQK